MYKNHYLTPRSPIQRSGNPLKARRQPSVKRLRRIIERENKAVGDDRLIVGVLPVRSSCGLLLVERPVQLMSLRALTSCPQVGRDANGGADTGVCHVQIAGGSQHQYSR